MDVGIGLPNAVPGTSPQQLTDFARAADQAGFSTLGTIDRIVYPSYEPLVALGAAATVTERIRLSTTVALGPLRQNAALLAKQALTLNALSGGRFDLGIGLGARDDDFEISRVSMKTRGKWLDEALPTIRAIWDGEGESEARVGPRAQSQPGLIVGGYIEKSVQRAARYGDGWMLGGGTPGDFGELARKLEEAWKEAGRQGAPRKTALAYYALGPDGAKDAQAYLGDYYAYLGEETAGGIVDSAAKDPDTVKAYLQAFEEQGCDELVLFASNGDPKQVELLAEAAGL
jgi:alkanesulfonate monooxygenase SsuD/methylene tetrahydromethanopterin reductase-like flavin-dependent oxidoreductase (luciferase family)